MNSQQQKEKTRNREDPRSKKNTPKLPFKDIDELMAVVHQPENLVKFPYSQRCRIGYEIGHQVKLGKLDKEKFQSWYRKVRDTPKPLAPEIELDSELSEILPAQTHSFAKYFTSQQIAMWAAKETGDPSFLREELHSPSILFHNFAAKHFVHHAKVSDDEIEKEVRSTVPKVARKLIHECVPAKRQKFLDRMLDNFYEYWGVDMVASILHGCSDEVILKHMQEARIRSHRYLHKDCLVKYHPKVFLKMLREELEEQWPKDAYYVSSIWDRWYHYLGRPNIEKWIIFGNASSELFELYVKYTPCHWRGSSYVTRSTALPLNEAYTQWVYPTMLDLNVFFRQQSDNLIQYWKERTQSLAETYYASVSSLIPSTFWSRKDLSFSDVFDLFSHIVGLSDGHSILRTTSLDYIIYQQLHKIMAKCPYSKIEEFLELSMKHLTKVHKAMSKIHWYHVDSLVNTTFSAFTSRIRTLHAEAVNKSLYFWKKDYDPAAWNRILERCIQLRLDYLYLYCDVDDKHARPRLLLNIFGIIFSNELVDTKLKKSLYDKHILPVLGLYKTYKSTTEFKNWLDSVSNLFETYCQNMIKVSKNPRFYPNASLASQCALESFKDLQSWYKGANMLNDSISPLIKFLNMFQSQEVAEIIVKHATKEVIQESAKLREGLEIHQLMKYLSKETRAEVITWLQEENISTETLRDELLFYEDISQIQTRHKMEKAASSNNPTERLAAYQHMFGATEFANTTEHTERTLKWLQPKIANEAVSRRGEALSALFDEGLTRAKHTTRTFFDLIKTANSAAVFERLELMLSDALEAPDLDEESSSAAATWGAQPTSLRDQPFAQHSILKHFLTLSHQLMTAAYPNNSGNLASYTKNPQNPANALDMPKADPKLFEFAVGLQYKMTLFRKGERPTAQEFRILFPAMNPAPNLQSEMVNQVLELYEKLCGPKHAEWKLEPGFWSTLVKFLQTDSAFEKTGLPELARAFLKSVTDQSKKDKDGLYIWPESHQVVQVYQNLRGKVRDEFLEALLHSRLAKKFGMGDYMTKTAITNRGKFHRLQGRQEAVEKFLSISQSAIHMPFVWAYLVKHRQDMLNDFINAKKSFRGVFYIEPNERRLTVKRKKPVATKKVVTRARAAPRGRAVVSNIKSRAATLSVEEAIMTEEEKEKTMVREVEEDQIEDHVDFWCLPGCWDFKRLTDSQATQLGKQWWAQTENPNRAIPDKVTAVKRWTILPTTTYYDIATAYTVCEKKKFAVNLLESMLRGITINDEPTAPLHFLLSPKFLKTPRSRISIYAVCAIIPYIRRGGLTLIIKSMLTGERRKVLKITVFKELIRLLAATPIQKHIDMILYEWNRKELHRDVRIAILTSAFRFLQTEKQQMKDVAWKILASASESEDPEIQLALLCARCLSVNPTTLFLTSYCQRERIIDHVGAFGKFELNQTDGSQYVSDILIPLVNKSQDDDLRFLGLLALLCWQTYSHKAAEESALIAYKFLTNTSHPLLLSDIPRENTVFLARWQALLPYMFSLCGLTSTYGSNHPAPVDNLKTISEVLCETLLHLKESQREVRLNVLSMIKSWLRYLPTSISESHNDLILLPLIKTKMFTDLLLDRRQTRFSFQINLKMNIQAIYLQFLEDCFRMVPVPESRIATCFSHCIDHFRDTFLNAKQYTPYIQAIHASLLQYHTPSLANQKKVLNRTIEWVTTDHRFLENSADTIFRFVAETIKSQNYRYWSSTWTISTEFCQWAKELIGEMLQAIQHKNGDPNLPRNLLFCELFEQLWSSTSNGQAILLYACPELMYPAMHLRIEQRARQGQSIENDLNPIFDEYTKTDKFPLYSKLVWNLFSMTMVKDFKPYPAYAQAIAPLVASRAPRSPQFREWKTIAPLVNFFLYTYFHNVRQQQNIMSLFENLMLQLNPTSAPSKGFDSAFKFSQTVIAKFLKFDVPTQWLAPDYKPYAVHSLQVLAAKMVAAFGNSNRIEVTIEGKGKGAPKQTKRVWRDEYLALLKQVSDLEENPQAREIGLSVSVR